MKGDPVVKGDPEWETYCVEVGEEVSKEMCRIRFPGLQDVIRIEDMTFTVSNKGMFAPSPSPSAIAKTCLVDPLIFATYNVITHLRNYIALIYLLLLLPHRNTTEYSYQYCRSKGDPEIPPTQ